MLPVFHENIFMTIFIWQSVNLFLIAYLLIYLQLNLIIDLLGTPSLDDLCRAGASEGATKYILQKRHKAVSLLNPNVSDCVFPFIFNQKLWKITAPLIYFLTTEEWFWL